MPIYQGRRKGTWRVTVYSRGQQHEWIFEGTKREAKRFEDERRTELRARPVASTRGIPTFSDFCTSQYEPHARLHLGARTWRNVRRYQLAAMCRHFKETPLEQIGPLVESYKRACLDRGCKPSTINHDLETLRTMLNWAHRSGWLASVPAIGSLPSTGKRRVHFWTMAELRRLYAATPAWLTPMLHFLLDTGCRKGEAIAAEWTWVDWERGMLRIPVTDTWHPKDKDAREVPLASPLMTCLRSLPRSGRTIFRTRLGGAYKRFPDREFKAAVDAAGLKGGPHTTRHTYASHFLAARPDLVLLAEVLGHSQMRVTELYSHMLPDHLERARGAVSLGPPSKLWRTTLAERASARNR